MSDSERLSGFFRTKSPEELLESARNDFDAALSAMPFGADRISKGQQFNSYESASNDEDGDPADWEYVLALGPITDAVSVLSIESEWRAKLIESALRVAMRDRNTRAGDPS